MIETGILLPPQEENIKQMKRTRIHIVAIAMLIGFAPLLHTATAQVTDRKIKNIVLIAGKKSHGPEGNRIHDYPWSVKLLKVTLEDSNIKDKINVRMHFNGWPKNANALNDADTVMIISDGRDGPAGREAPHLTNPKNIAEVDKLIQRGCGLITFHFSTFGPDKHADRMFKWTGGYFDWETDGKRKWYSAIKTIDTQVQIASAGHPLTYGVRPFRMREEFYYNMRFEPNDKGLTPILQVPALKGRADKGNVVAWAKQRADGGRGFGTTCGHFYDNWKHDHFRKTILNAIAWTAHVAVPKGGVDAPFFDQARITAALAVTQSATGKSSSSQSGSDYPANAKNTEKAGNPPTAVESLKMIDLPKGFRATLFAAEPDVAQPICLNFDDRGRLWVVECFSYESSGGPWNQPIKDRILIFEDTDGDGKFDKRKVFTDQQSNVTSALPGFGGVWVTATPKLLFIPDKNGDDQPDSEPIVMLDGWNNGKIGHCVVNGLTWGPDGWLYGRQGIQGESKIGKPGTADDARRKFNGGIWRYHPARGTFEVVTTGTTNPWGLDWNEHGQAFFTNCVIGHLWHMIPGAHLKRMYGQDYTPNTYGLIDQHADHLHWAGKKWQDSRKGDAHQKLGGGHAHCGAMIYLGDNWPSKYRDSIFTHNIHGRQLNNDTLVRHGSGYIGKHGQDILATSDPWFRGTVVKYGPDGGVYLADWSDIGECHDTNNVHRFSGRIYKVTFGQPKTNGAFDLSKQTDDQLVALQTHRNEWYVRQARRILQQRAVAGKDLAGAHNKLRKLLADAPTAAGQLRALWALFASGGMDDAGLTALLDHESEHLRVWAIQLLVDDKDPPADAVKKFADMAANDPSALVRLYLASALQRMPIESRWDIAAGLVGHEQDKDDHNLPLMIWYGIEPAVAADPTRALTQLAAKTKIPLVRQYIARRAAQAARKKKPGK